MCEPRLSPRQRKTADASSSDAGHHVVERAADGEQTHTAVQERDRDEQDDRGEDARRTMHHFPFGRNASNTLPGAWLN